MKKSLLSAVDLTALIAFSGNAWADQMVGVAGPITSPNSAFGAQGFEPEAYTLYSSAALQAIAEAATAAKSNDPQEVAKALHEKGPFKTVLGDLSYDAKGDPTLPGYVMYEWKKGDDGKYTYVQKM